MVFSYEEKVINKYPRIKCNYQATRIIDYHPGYEWNLNGLRKLLKKISKTVDVARKEDSGRRQFVRTEENSEPVEGMFLSEEDQQESPVFYTSRNYL